MNRFGLAILALVIGQSLFLAAMVWDRVSLLRSENVVTLRTAPVDPRDIFRGDYVILNYDIAQLPLAYLEGDSDFTSGDTVLVELAQENETWKAVSVWHEGHEAAPDDLIIRGRITYISPPATTASPGSEGGVPAPPCTDCSVLNVDYGIESYFVPEGEGRALEDERNAGKLTVDVALGDDGIPAIKRLRIDGTPVYEEPLF
ncbi:GDYXXLXY domain-containing protein [Parvibaculum sp.]|uniref:GDYXXLXY domain-containing protein n=1 Tax=Parvibaculum sp. TaxID=2024848 RepID=UPI003BAC0851